jgi:hypothetical protein
MKRDIFLIKELGDEKRYLSDKGIRMMKIYTVIKELG